jgi:hypothetical protein
VPRRLQKHLQFSYPESIPQGNIRIRVRWNNVEGASPRSWCRKAPFDRQVFRCVRQSANLHEFCLELMCQKRRRTRGVNTDKCVCLVHRASNLFIFYLLMSIPRLFVFRLYTFHLSDFTPLRAWEIRKDQVSRGAGRVLGAVLSGHKRWTLQPYVRTVPLASSRPRHASNAMYYAKLPPTSMLAPVPFPRGLLVDSRPAV